MYLSKCAKFQLYKIGTSCLLYNEVCIVNNILLYTQNFSKRIYLTILILHIPINTSNNNNTNNKNGKRKLLEDMVCLWYGRFMVIVMAIQTHQVVSVSMYSF